MAKFTYITRIRVGTILTKRFVKEKDYIRSIRYLIVFLFFCFFLFFSRFDDRFKNPPTDALWPIISDNACILRVITAAGTELADAYSP